jgi:orotidine-5'-phosphate decarboxylase
LIVLVDRQQGWKKKFQELGVNLDVWAGMTLHDVRRFLITKGLMARCDKEREEKNPLILALDGKDWEDILPLLDQLRTSGCIFKVNDLLFAKGLDNIIPDLSVYGRVMADIKGHDIPNTLANISKRMLANPPWAVTVHASGGEEMMKAVVETFKGTPTKVLAVTVLTSIDEKIGDEIYHRLPLEQVKVLAAIAARAGVHGFVCSPQEVWALKALYHNMIAVTPGVRSEGKDAGDQKRISTPKGAMDNGADYIVGGRQFLGAPDPVAEVSRMLKEELGIS